MLIKKVSAHPSEKQMEKLRLGEGGGEVEGGEVGGDHDVHDGGDGGDGDDDDGGDYDGGGDHDDDGGR